MDNIENVIEKVKKIIGTNMIACEKKATNYTSNKFIKDGLSAKNIVKNLRKMPDFEALFRLACSKKLGGLSLSSDAYAAMDAAGFCIETEISRALEDISVVVSDAIGRAEVFAYSAAVRDVFGGDVTYQPAFDKAWKIAVGVVDGNDNIAKACVIEVYLDILSVMRDTKNIALQNVCMKVARGV